MSQLGQKRTSRDVRSMSALPPITDIPEHSWRGRIGPEPDNRQLSRNYHSRVQLPPKPGGCWCGQSGNWAIAKIALIKAASRTIFSIAHIHASLLPERTIGSVWLAQNVKRGCRQNNRSHACEHDNR